MRSEAMGTERPSALHRMISTRWRSMGLGRFNVGLGVVGLAVGLSGCAMPTEGSDDGGASEAEMLDESSEALYRSSGAIKALASDKIFWLTSDSGGYRLCWIKDMGQLAALQHVSRGNYQGFNRPTEEALRADRAYDGHCRYPTYQMYQNIHENPVYHLRGDHTYCWVRTEAGVTARGGRGSVLKIDEPLSKMDLSEKNWADSNDLMHTSARNKYVGDCP